MDHRKLSSEPFPDAVPEDDWWLNEEEESSGQGWMSGRRTSEIKLNTSLTSKNGLSDESNALQHNDGQGGKHKYPKIEPELIVYCVDLISNYPTFISPNEYLIYQLRRKKHLQENELLIISDIFFGVLDGDRLLEDIVQRFKSSRRMKDFKEWQPTDIAGLKTLTFLYFRWSRCLRPCDQFEIYRICGVPLALSYYEFLVKFRVPELLAVLTGIYSPEYVDKYLLPNALIGNTVLKEVLIHYHRWSQPKRAALKPTTVTAVKPFTFETRRPNQSSIHKRNEEAIRMGSSFKAKRAPVGTYKQSAVNKRLEKEFQKNRRRSMQLLEAVRRSTFALRQKDPSYTNYHPEEDFELEEPSDEEAFDVVEEEQIAESAVNEHNVQEMRLSVLSNNSVRMQPKKGRASAKTPITRKETIAEKGKGSDSKRVPLKVKTKSLHLKATPSNQEPLPVNKYENKKKKADEAEFWQEAVENGTGLSMEQGQEEVKVNEEFEGENGEDEQTFSLPPLEGVFQEDRMPRRGLRNLLKQEPTSEMKKIALNRVLAEPAFRGGPTFASTVRLQKLYQLRDEKEREELDNLFVLAPSINLLENERLVREENEARSKRFNQIKLALKKANEAAYRHEIANQRKADYVRKEAAKLQQVQASEKLMELERMKLLADWVKQGEAHAAFKVKLSKKEKKDQADDMRKRANDLLTETKQKAEMEKSVIAERIQKIQADRMFTNAILRKPFRFIKKPFQDEKSENAEVEAQLRREVIRRREEAQLSQLREKIKNQKEERAAKYARALEDIEKGRIYSRRQMENKY